MKNQNLYYQNNKYLKSYNRYKTLLEKESDSDKKALLEFKMKQAQLANEVHQKVAFEGVNLYQKEYSTIRKIEKFKLAIEDPDLDPLKKELLCVKIKILEKRLLEIQSS